MPYRLPRRAKALLAMTLMLSISACSGDVKQQLGIKNESPDEFAVERRPSLSVPPDFKMRAPDPNALPLGKSEVREQVKQSILGSSGSTDADKSDAESAFIGKLGASNSNPSIRQTLQSEQGVEDPDFLDRVRSISDENNLETLVDAEKERERIAKNKQEGKPVTEGETPAKAVNADKSVVEKILGE